MPFLETSSNLQLVEILRLAVPSLDRPRELQQTIGERRLPMVDVCDDREVPNPFYRVLTQIEPTFLVILAGVRTKFSLSIEKGSKWR